MKIPISKRRIRIRASLLIEVTAGFGAMLIVSLLLLKTALTVTAVQRWTVTQGLSDAYMSREVALGKRLPFDGVDGFLTAGSVYPVAPASSTVAVTVGRLPGALAITGDLRRTRLPSPNNLPANGGTGTAITNPTGTEAWQLQSYLTYTISGRPYVKSRTVLRAR